MGPSHPPPQSSDQNHPASSPAELLMEPWTVNDPPGCTRAERTVANEVRPALAATSRMMNEAKPDRNSNRRMEESTARHRPSCASGG
jgi:hypothetical protein